MAPVAIYAGSFDPFTYGHFEILKKAAEIFDIYILIANNSSKSYSFFEEERMEFVMDALRRNSSEFKREGTNIKVAVWKGFVADFARENNIKYSVRGIRNFMDYGYEENIAKINQERNPNLETIYFRSGSDYISSTFVRDMLGMGVSVDKYVPYNIMKSLGRVGKKDVNNKK